MEPLSFILGLLGLSFLLLVVAWYIGEIIPLKGISTGPFGALREWTHKHTTLKVLFVGFVLYLLFFVPRMMWEDDRQSCDILLTQTNTSYNTTDYTYARQCYATNNTTGLSVFKLYGRLLWLTAIYGMIVAFFILIRKVLDWRKL